MTVGPDVSRGTSDGHVSRGTFDGHGLEAAFVDALRTAPLNLVSRRDRDLLEARHLPEARAFVHALGAPPKVVDVGSGGGLPGLVAAIWLPASEIVLIESRQRKAAWLTATADGLGLSNVEVVRERAESAGRLADVGCVTARAVAPLDRLLGLCAPLAGPGVRLHAVKGARWAEELEAAQPVAARGWDVVATPDDHLGNALTTGPSDEAEAHPLVVILQRRD